MRDPARRWRKSFCSGISSIATASETARSEKQTCFVLRSSVNQPSSNRPNVVRLTGPGTCCSLVHLTRERANRLRYHPARLLKRVITRRRPDGIRGQSSNVQAPVGRAGPSPQSQTVVACCIKAKLKRSRIRREHRRWNADISRTSKLHCHALHCTSSNERHLQASKKIPYNCNGALNQVDGGSNMLLA